MRLASIFERMTNGKQLVSQYHDVAREIEDLVCYTR